MRESILVEENSAKVLSDDVKVLRQRTVSDKARTLLYANHMPRAIELRSQQARITTSCRSRVPKEDLELVSLTPVALIRTKSRPTRTTKRLLQEYPPLTPSTASSRSSWRCFDLRLFDSSTKSAFSNLLGNTAQAPEAQLIWAQDL